MCQLNQKDTQFIQQSLLDWFSENARALPWRSNYNPYHIWISEVMLQQTQMERGVNYFLRWIERFPDVGCVAEAGEQEIMKYWEGLGYYSRARNLHKTARILSQNYGGFIPDDYKILLSLPGIGEYTASAIASIGFNQDYPVKDANVERVYSRLFDIDMPIKAKETVVKVKSIAAQMLPTGRAREFNQALMDFGAQVCTPKNPDCNNCLLQNVCMAYVRETVAQRPIVSKKEKQIIIEMVSGILVCNDLIYIQQRLEKDVWGGLWEFPGGRPEAEEKRADALTREFFEETEIAIEVCSKLTEVVHYYTKYKVILHCYGCRVKNNSDKLPSPVLHAAQQYRWITMAQIDDYAFSAGHRKIINQLLQTDPQKFENPCEPFS